MLLDGVGPVVLEPSARARRLSVTVRPGLPPRVAVPRHVSFATAARFAGTMRRWLQRQTARWSAVGPPTVLVPLDVPAARARLAGRLAALAATHGFTYGRVIFRRQRTLWGSCSSRNDISLNLKLVRLPEALIDYVLLHELTHTRVKHHGRAFWQALEGCVPGSRAVHRRLRAHARDLSD